MANDSANVENQQLRAEAAPYVPVMNHGMTYGWYPAVPVILNPALSYCQPYLWIGNAFIGSNVEQYRMPIYVQQHQGRISVVQSKESHLKRGYCSFHILPVINYEIVSSQQSA